jgi:hypothetical protein
MSIGQKLIVHCCHHRVGTDWFDGVLGAISQHYGLRFQHCTQDELKTNTDIFLQDHSAVDVSILPPFSGSHIIRDPRDIVVSAYFYHKWTREWHVHIPKVEFGGLSYQQHLNAIPQEEGILAQMRNTRGSIRPMLQWDYNNPDFVEITYENIIEHEEQTFYDIFKHYGFSHTEATASVGIAKEFSFERKTKRKIGMVEENSHLRSGRTNQWEDIFSDQHKEYFKTHFGDVLITLGYEANHDW